MMKTHIGRKLAGTTAAMLCAAALLQAPAIVSAASYSSSEWAIKDSYEARQIGLIPDKVWGNFQSAITRAELSGVIVRLYERLTNSKAPAAATNPFKDTKDADVLKASALGIIGGTGAGKFSPDAAVTREQLAVMLYNTLVKAGLQEEINGDKAAAFVDSGAIASWAVEAVNKLAAAGIMQGAETKSGLQFQPKASVTREQVFVLANRIAKNTGPSYVDSEYALLDAVEQHGKPIILQDARTKQIYDQALRINSEIIKPGMTEFDKELAIHDYIVLHTAYDYDNYLAGTIPEDSYSAYGVFFKGTAVCQGYAYAAHLLLELAGIDSQIVSGTANGISHAWNKVNIGGEYYNLDVTWDDPVPNVEGRTMYAYFNVTDEQLADDHKWEMDKFPSATATAANYYESKGLVVRSAEEMKERLKAAISSRSETVTFRVDYEGDVQADMMDTIFSGGTVSQFSYSYNGTVFVVTLTYDS
ncbi:S-layer family protein [Paenibacillus cellulosilyticus]|uniref:S-layer family protein n=1 Tax=Paenibacillus cellulosilyticus TaxID=375489 RepID=A0A2V2YZE1_9BACL|nr:S-layer homology domain-containing protein [Paenibacillus cellulosilyticus]PWV98694.1 S-layer family protein [Paenibacillus cellulosilyticus]QKS43804.1 S-layer homology domain-containing protein [Paenibacillus cellulosilyticus]